MTFAELKAAILAIIGRAPADVCYQMVTAEINASLRLTVMEQTATITEGASIALPADFLSVVSIYRDTDPRIPLRPTTAQGINNTHVTTGTPMEYAIVDGAMLLNPAPDGAEDIVLRYVAKLDDLSADSDTNPVLTKYPGIYVYGALAHHGALTRNEAMGAWSSTYVEQVKLARAADGSDRYSGAPLMPSVRVTP